MHRLSLLASVAFLAMAGAASAADLTMEAPAETAAPVATTFDWTGFYAGVHVGGIFAREKYNVQDTSADADGVIAGLQAGYNVQYDHYVIGAQTDFSYSSAKTDDDPGDKLEWLGTTTVRLGYAWDQALLYAKGGVAYGEGKGYFEDFSDSHWHVGWTAGAGVEYAFTKNLTGLLEYDYVDLGSKTYFSDEVPGGVDASITAHIAKAGLNYKF